MVSAAIGFSLGKLISFVEIDLIPRSRLQCFDYERAAEPQLHKKLRKNINQRPARESTGEFRGRNPEEGLSRTGMSPTAAGRMRRYDLAMIGTE
jgi:hypothetical protein